MVVCLKFLKSDSQLCCVVGMDIWFQLCHQFFFIALLLSVSFAALGPSVAAEFLQAAAWPRTRAFVETSFYKGATSMSIPSTSFWWSSHSLCQKMSHCPKHATVFLALVKFLYNISSTLLSEALIVYSCSGHLWHTYWHIHIYYCYWSMEPLRALHASSQATYVGFVYLNNDFVGDIVKILYFAL